MKNNKAFTLFEVIIAMSLSLFIMMFLTRYYLNVISNINKNRTMISLNRKVYLLFDQLEKDFSNAFIPSFKIDPPTPSVATEDKRSEQEEKKQDKSVDSTDEKKDQKPNSII